MYKKFTAIIFTFYGYYLLLFTNAFATDGPKVNCIGLPGCNMDNFTDISSENGASQDLSINWIGNVIGETIQYVAVMAVISLMLAGIFYIFSGGEEEKTKKAKTWIIWSLAGVLISISAWGIIQAINKISI